MKTLKQHIMPHNVKDEYFLNYKNIYSEVGFDQLRNIEEILISDPSFIVYRTRNKSHWEYGCEIHGTYVKISHNIQDILEAVALQILDSYKL